MGVSTQSPLHALLIALLVLLIAACAPPEAGSTVATEDRPISTTGGLALGVVDGDILTFRGIPFASAARWKLPEEAPGWTGTRRFDTFGAPCPQDGQPASHEDCLFLNVFAPADSLPGDKHPVLVWFHGGGFRSGTSGDAPASLTSEGIIVVTPNYRLGELGFDNQPDWPADRPRNYGQADMVAALEWVQANINGFGGDPANITIGGHSAGGMAVQLMMVDPRADGLFHRAISHSGYGTWPFPDIDQFPAPTARPKAEMTSEELVARTPFFHLPYIGGPDLPAQPIDLFRAGRHARVPYMANANDYEGVGIICGAGYREASFLDRYRDINAIRTLYAADFAVADDEAARRLFGDMRYLYASWATADAVSASGQPVYLSHYTARTPGQPGATHGAHIGPLFNDPDFPMRAYLVNFIRTGTPNSKNLPRWPRYTPETRSWMIFTPAPTPADAPLKEKLDTLQSLAFPTPDR